MPAHDEAAQGGREPLAVAASANGHVARTHVYRATDGEHVALGTVTGNLHHRKVVPWDRSARAQ